MTAFAALNYIENGGEICVSLPGFVSCLWRLNDKKEFERENSCIGVCSGDGMTAGKALKHFQTIIEDGGEITAL